MAPRSESRCIGVAQQFQFHNKLTYLKWLLPNAPHNHEAFTQAWYLPKALPNALKPRVPGETEEHDSTPDDEEGIMQSVDTVDELVKAELAAGVSPDRLFIGGFSQGCAVSLIWGLTGRMRNQVAGVVCMSGYFPLASRIKPLREERSAEGEDQQRRKKWLLLHGSKDMLVPLKLFEQEKRELAKWVEGEDVEEHVYEGMSHTTSPKLLRDLLLYLEKIIPP